MDLRLLLRRRPSGPVSTIGRLFDISKFETETFLCFTCEDVVRTKKIKDITAIFAGLYEIVITLSARFKRKLPLLLNVPEFDGVRIHPGNTAENTEGCILLGEGTDGTAVSGSQVACSRVQKMIEDAIASGGKVYIEIRNG